MRTSTHVDIDRPIDQVFHLATDNVCAWSKTCVEEQILNETPDGVGTTFHMVTEDSGQRMDFDGVVTEYDPPKLSRVSLTGKSFDLDVLYVFEDLGGRTRVTQEAEVFGKGFVRLMFFLFGWAMKKSSCSSQENELESLKRYCESSS